MAQMKWSIYPSYSCPSKRFAVATIRGRAVRPSTLHMNEIGNTDSHIEHQVFHQIRHMLREVTTARHC